MTRTQFTITPAAEKFMRRIVRFSGLPDGAGFRLLVTSGGCSGYGTEFSAEATPQPGDEIYKASDGLQIFLPAESRLLLDGATLDFIDTPMQSGLSVRSPASDSCGCSGAGDSAQASATVGVPLSALIRR